MELCDKYLYELIEINPTINDFFILKEFIHKRHIQPNVYSERYYEKLYQLDSSKESITINKQKFIFNHEKIDVSNELGKYKMIIPVKDKYTYGDGI